RLDGPGGSRSGRFVQHEVHGERAGRGVCRAEGVAALVLYTGPVRVGEPDPDPCGRTCLHVLQQRVADQVHPQEVRGKLLGTGDGEDVVASTDTAHHCAREPSTGHRSSLTDGSCWPCWVHAAVAAAGTTAT